LNRIIFFKQAEDVPAYALAQLVGATVPTAGRSAASAEGNGYAARCRRQNAAGKLWEQLGLLLLFVLLAPESESLGRRAFALAISVYVLTMRFLLRRGLESSNRWLTFRQQRELRTAIV